MDCPKCGEEMRSYERNNVTVDQCTGCRGIFLDRGELERLMEAESAFVPQSRTADDSEHGDYRRREHDKHAGRGRRGGFLSDLFE